MPESASPGPGLEALLGLGIGAIRVPFDDRGDLESMVEQAAANDAYTVVSVQAAGDTARSGAEAIGVWRALGERFADEPAVLFEMTGAETDWDRWSLWVRLVVAELHRVHPRAVCIVAALGEGSDLSGFPILGTASEPIPNLVYGATLSADAEPPFRALTGSLPILVTSLDVPSATFPARAATLAALGIGWIAAAPPERPLVAARRGGRLEPTVHGRTVQRALSTLPERPLVEPRRPSAVAALASQGGNPWA